LFGAVGYGKRESTDCEADMGRPPKTLASYVARAILALVLALLQAAWVKWFVPALH
jgi:hypothetical protein